MKQTVRKPVAWLLAVVSLSSTGLALSHQSQVRATHGWLARPVGDEVFETYLGFFSIDSHLPFETKVVTEAKEHDGIREERFSFRSTPGERVTARLFWPAPSGQTRVALLLHGGGGEGKDGPGPSRIGEFLTRAGWSVMAIDMKHFGERNAGLLTTFTESDKHENLYNQPSVYLDWVTQTVKDVQRSVEFLIRERKVDPGRIVLVGVSRGAQAALIAGAVEKRFAAVISIVGGHFDALEREHLPAACPANYVARIAPRRLFMLNAAHDVDFDRKASVEPIFELAREPKTIHWADHGHGFTDEDLSAVLKWLQENVSK